MPVRASTVGARGGGGDRDAKLLDGASGRRRGAMGSGNVKIPWEYASRTKGFSVRFSVCAEALPFDRFHTKNLVGISLTLCLTNC